LIVNSNLFDHQRRRQRIDREMIGIDRGDSPDRREPKLAVAHLPRGRMSAATAFPGQHTVGGSVQSGVERRDSFRDQIVQITLAQPEDPLVRAEPKPLFTIFEDAIDHVIGKTITAGDRGKFPLAQQVQTSAVSSNPQVTGRTLEQAGNGVARQSVTGGKGSELTIGEFAQPA
jgi:hypothetical protein